MRSVPISNRNRTTNLSPRPAPPPRAPGHDEELTRTLAMAAGATGVRTQTRDIDHHTVSMVCFTLGRHGGRSDGCLYANTRR